MSTLATLIVKLVGDIGGFTKPLEDAEKTAEHAGDTFASKLGGGLKTVGTAAAGIAVAGILAVGAAAVGSIATTTDWANQLDDLGDVLGTTADQSAALTVALSPYGDAADQITGQTAKLVMSLKDTNAGASANAQLLTDMGIAFKDANGAMLPATDLLENIANKVAVMPDGLDKTSLMMTLFGKSGKGMSDALGALTTEGLDAATRKAEAFGLTIGDSGVDNALQFQKGLNDLGLAGKGLAVSVGNTLLPMLLPLIQRFVELAVQVMPQVRAGIQIVGQFLAGLIASFSSGQGTIGAVAAFLQAAFNKVTSWVTENWPLIEQTFNTVFNAVQSVVEAVWPIVSTVITVAMDLILGTIKTVMQLINGDWSGAWDTFKGIFVAIWNSLSPFVEGVWSGIKGVVAGGINGIIDLVNGMINDINDAVIWSNTYLGTSIHGLDLMARVSFAEGGIVSRPTPAIVGDSPRGPEVVAPLSDLKGMLGGGDGGAPITVNISVGNVALSNGADEKAFLQSIAQAAEQGLRQALGQSTRYPVGLSRVSV